MKEVCGFTDVRGRFHKTQKDCEIAEIKYKIEGTKMILDKFETRVADYIRKNNSNYHFTKEFEFHKYAIFEIVARAVLEQSDEFIAIINEKKNLAKELDILERQYYNEIHKPWWLKLKWWN